MSSKRIFWISSFAAVVLSASLAMGAPRGGGGHFSSMSPRGGQTLMRGGPGAWSGQRWNGRNWSGRNWNGRNWNNWGGNWHHHHHNDIIFIGDFGFPWWWGWGSWGYPYGYYGYGYPYYGYGYGGDGYGYGDYGYGGYGNNYGQGQPGYGYGSGTRSRVAELQRRLARAGYYNGSVDGVMGPQTRRAIRAYERAHGYAG